MKAGSTIRGAKLTQAMFKGTYLSMAGLECLEDATDETLDMRACHIAHFENKMNCTLPWRRDLNPNYAECINKSKFDSFRKYYGAINKMNVEEISTLTGCVQACRRTEFKSKVKGEFVRYGNASTLSVVRKYNS